MTIQTELKEPYNILENKLRKHFPSSNGNVIHYFEGGSRLYGTSINATSDTDIFGVFIETPAYRLGLDSFEHFVSIKEDADFQMHSLARWAELATKGNPTQLTLLYTPCVLNSVWSEIVLPNKSLFKAKIHAKAFLGYAQGQVHRLDGTAGKGKHGQRPELERSFGYDTKAAMHLMRLLFEAEEYMKTGEITYPRPEKELLLSIRQGAWTWDRLFFEYNEAEKRVESAMQESKLPEHCDREAISHLVAECYLTHWEHTLCLEDYR